MRFRRVAPIFSYLLDFVSWGAFVWWARTGEVTRGVAIGCNRQGTSSIRGGEGCGSGGERA